MFNLFKNQNNFSDETGNQFERIVAGLFDAVIAYDKDFRIFIFNKAAERILGVEAAEVLNKKITPEGIRDVKYQLLCQVFFPSLAPLVINKSAEGELPVVSDIVFSTPNLVLRVSTNKIVDHQGRLLGFVKVLHDRTREEDILKSKSEFIEVAAHQLRTPLTSVNWIFESLQKEEMGESAKELVVMGSQAIANALKTVNDLLDASQIEEGKFGFQFENFDLIKLLENVLQDLLPYAKENGINIYLKKPQDQSATVYVDSQKLAIALTNLITNSIKYNTENGEVVVEIEKMSDKPFYLIKVKDTGIGIPPESIKNLFSKFFRADNAQKKVTDGSGLGLYIVRNIIKRHGGEIWAESELNRGSTFYVSIPSDPSLVPRSDIMSEEDE